jgi:F-type H+-transporting ATPase subunit epsilon
MPKQFHLKVNTPSGIFFEDDIFQIELRTTSGYIGILADHAPIIGGIVPSICYIRDNKGNRLPAVINNGIFKMDGKTINVITDFFDFTKNINDSVFKLREQQIQSAINNKNLTDAQAYEKVKIKLQSELNKLKELSKK